MKPRDFMDVADELAAGTKEADWRSAVSRAYYAAFHAARQLLQHCGFEVPQADQAHAYLWLRLSNAGHLDMREAGNSLKYVRQRRNWADYDLDREMDQAAAISYVEIADQVLAILETALTEPTVCATLTAAIKVYERDVLRQVTWRP